jgi:hypothetical protein
LGRPFFVALTGGQKGLLGKSKNRSFLVKIAHRAALEIAFVPLLQPEAASLSHW